MCQGRSARAASISLSMRSMTSCLSKALARFFTRLIAATERKIARTAEPTSSAGRSVRPGLSAATPEDSARAKSSAVASLVRNSAVTSLSEADRDARWTTQWVGDGCITDAIRANQLPWLGRARIAAAFPASLTAGCVAAPMLSAWRRNAGEDDPSPRNSAWVLIALEISRSPVDSERAMVVPIDWRRNGEKKPRRPEDGAAGPWVVAPAGGTRAVRRRPRPKRPTSCPCRPCRHPAASAAGCRPWELRQRTPRW